MTTNYPSYAEAEAEAAAAEAADRPDWAQTEFPLEKGHGKVASIEEVTHTTKNGTALGFYEIHLSGHVSEKAARPDAPAVLPVIKPKAGGRNAKQQPYFWMLEAARAKDASIDNIGALVGKEISYELSTRKPFESATYPSYFYKITVGSNGASKPATPTFTDEQLDEAAQKVIGLDSAAAVAAVGPDLMGKLLTAPVKRVAQVEGIYVLKENATV